MILINYYYLRHMKRIISIAFLAFVLMTSAAFPADSPDKTPQVVYIEQFATLAVEEMYRSGVPASITLAQGLLESRYGLSELAVKGNNHFGIKCHNTWKGGKMYHDDDRKGECFRKYSSPEESFRDHSDFLRYRDRYKFLFDLESGDYKGWAHGLKKAGYATDPAYPQKLIRLIEEYGLHQYDTKTLAWAYGQDMIEEKADVKAKADKKAGKDRKNDKEHPSDELPVSPNKLEEAKPFDAGQRETFRFSLSRQMYSHNGVPFVYASDGETYASIAAANNLFLKEILKYNDLDQEQGLYPGTVVYLQPKKKQAAKGLDKYVVEGYSENLRDIAQRFAVKLDKICKMNGMTPDRPLADGDVIKLRK